MNQNQAQEENSFQLHPPAWKFSLVFGLVLICAFVRPYSWLWPELWPVLLSFVAIPLIDYWIGLDLVNATSAQHEKFLSSLMRYRNVTLLWVPFSILVLLDVLPRCTLASPDFSLFRAIFAIISLGIANGALGINIAHELIHKNGVERLFGRTLLVLVFYGHWEIEHLHGHHKRVATEEDPATAPRGMPFYRFWVKSIKGTWTSSWAFETENCRKKGSPAILGNRCFLATLYSISIALLVFSLWGWVSLAVYLGQAFVAISLLELVNYIEHYGLQRKKIGTDNTYEPVSHAHSWDSTSSVSNYLLFRVQRHADHHMNPLRRYQILRYTPEAPQMPYGYPTMVLIAMIPSLWFRTMHPILDQYLQSQRKIVK